MDIWKRRHKPSISLSYDDNHNVTITKSFIIQFTSASLSYDKNNIIDLELNVNHMKKRTVSQPTVGGVRFIIFKVEATICYSRNKWDFSP